MKVRTNCYSTPLKPGTRAQAKLLPAYVEIWQERECVARHERSFGRYEQVLDLEHYLDVLEKKPGALAGSSPLQQWRERGRWPESFDRLWQSLQERHGKHAGTREMIELLTLGKRHGWDRLKQAVEQGAGVGLHGCGRGAALADGDELSRPRTEFLELNGLERYERPLPVMNEYDQLLSIAATAGGGGAMKEHTQALEHASVKQYCKALRVPVIGAHFVPLAEQAVKEQRSHIGYLEALLAMEAEERDRHAIQQRLRDARLPRLKTLEEFDFNQARQIPAAKIRELAEGGYIERAEPVVLMGECGTGKTHLATGLCVAACRQKRRVRFTTAANLVNELVEARQHNAVRRVLARWLRYDVIVLDEVGYVPLADIGAEFLFQVIAERAERATLIVTTNLPFSEWTQVFPNPRLCKALLDRITDRAHIIETGTESYRFRRTLEVRQKKKSIVGADGVASTSLVQRKGLKRRPFLCTPSRLETRRTLPNQTGHPY